MWLNLSKEILDQSRLNEKLVRVPVLDATNIAGTARKLVQVALTNTVQLSHSKRRRQELF